MHLREVHLMQGDGNIDFGHVLQRIEQAGFRGHCLNAFGRLRAGVA